MLPWQIGVYCQSCALALDRRLVLAEQPAEAAGAGLAEQLCGFL